MGIMWNKVKGNQHTKSLVLCILLSKTWNSSIFKIERLAGQLESKGHNTENCILHTQPQGITRIPHLSYLQVHGSLGLDGRAVESLGAAVTSVAMVAIADSEVHLNV